MINTLLLLYPIGLLLLTFFGAKYAGKGEFCDRLWDGEQAGMIKAFACIGVILHHVTQLVTVYGAVSFGPITLFNSLGILFTSLFFFFSGYGLVYRVMHQPDYLDGFLLHRLPAVLVPFFLSNIIGVLIRLYYQNIPTAKVDIVKAVFGLVLLNGNGWYFVEIFFLYLAFYFSFKWIKNKDISICFLGIATVIIIYIGFQNGHDTSTVGDHWFMGEWWYNSTIVFIMGVLVARFRERVLAFSKKHYTKLLILTAILFVVVFRVEEYVLDVYGYYRESIVIDAINNKTVTLFAQMVLCIIFTWLVLLVNMKIAIGNKALSYISKISTEIFLLHGLFVKQIFSFRNWNVMLIYFVVIVCGIASASVLYLVDRPVIALIQSFGKGKGYLKKCEPDLLRQRREKKRKCLIRGVVSVILLAGVAYLCFEGYDRLIRTPLVCKKEIQALKNASVGDEVWFGRYESDLVKPGKERISWLILERKGNQYLLVAKKGLAGSVYHQKHAKIRWEQSNLQNYLNETVYKEMFSSSEQKYIISNPETEEMISLLSVKQAQTLFKNEESRQLALTEAAISEGTNVNYRSKVNDWDMKGYRSSWWWLRGDKAEVTAPIVSVDGTILLDEKSVNKPNGAVRPAIWISVK